MRHFGTPVIYENRRHGNDRQTLLDQERRQSLAPAVDVLEAEGRREARPERFGFRFLDQ
jgi:hypothetical protein